MTQKDKNRQIELEKAKAILDITNFMFPDDNTIMVIGVGHEEATTFPFDIDDLILKEEDENLKNVFPIFTVETSDSTLEFINKLKTK